MKKILYFLILYMKFLQFHFMEPTEIIIERPGKYALPENVKPEIYDLNLVTNLNAPKFSFRGDVTITVKCAIKDTKEIVLFAKKLEIFLDEIKVKFVNRDGSKIDMNIANRQYQSHNDLIIIVLEDELLFECTYEIYIPFKKGESIRQLESGYYSIKYKRYSTAQDVSSSEKTSEKRLAINYFDSVYASQTFPCFDLMDSKAIFKIKNAHEKSYQQGFSNMRLLRSEMYQGMKHIVQDVFADSVPMSPFLLAVAVTKFKPKKTMTFPEGIRLQIWADEIEDDELIFLHEKAVHAFNFYTKYFKILYALIKLDILIVPFYEQWNEEKYGLIVMNESFLLSPDDSSDEELAYHTALNICRTIGQQWIGTYVTMSWWDEYWFHEVFLFYTGIRCAEEATPAGEIIFYRQRILNSFFNTLSQDAGITSSPLMQSASTRNTSKFDSIDKFISTKHFEKAHQLFRMMDFFLGEEVMKKCVTNYLEKFKFGNSNLDQVWEVFSANAAEFLPPNTSMKDIMDRWIYQSGYPLITVEINPERNRVTLKQRRFFSLKKNERIENENDCWILPISYITKTQLKHKSPRLPIRDWFLCDNSLKSIDIELKNDEWILLDFPLGVLSRVNYDEANWKLLGDTLRNENEYKNIDEISRTRLILDMFELSKLGKLQYEIVFEIIKYVQHEVDFFAWDEAMNKLFEFRLYLFDTTALKPFEIFVAKLLERIFNKEEYKKIDDIDDKNHLRSWFKESVVFFSCFFNVEDCREQSLIIFEERYDELLGDDHDLGPIRLIRKTILCEGMRKADEEDWNSLLGQYRANIKSNLNSHILEALSCTERYKNLQYYLNWGISGGISTEVSVTVFRNVSYNEIGRTVIKDFVTEKFEKILSLYEDDIPRFQEFFEILFGATMKEEDLKELKKIIDPTRKELKNLKTFIEECQSQAAQNIEWLEQNEKILSELLSRV